MFLIGEWTVHRDFDSLTRHDEEVHVTPRAMDVLVHLAEHQGKLVTKEELLDRFWRGGISGDNAVHKTMAELRRVFKDSSKNPRYIRTYPKRGYQLIADVEWLEAGPPVEVTQPRSDMEAPPITLAVLPFLNMITVELYQHFGDALAQEIVNYLGRAGKLGVVSHTSSFRYRGQFHDPRELGTSLGATYIVEGSVRMEQDLIRTNVQLIATEHGRQVWAKRYDRVLIDQLTTQDELADTITTAIYRQFGLDESVFKPSPAQGYLKDILSQS